MLRAAKALPRLGWDKGLVAVITFHAQISSPDILPHSQYPLSLGSDMHEVNTFLVT
jgi:hypothetical protein